MAFDPITFGAVDINERMVSRTLLQFRYATVFQALISAFANEIQALIDGIISAQQLRTPLDADGTQLDVLGRIVGMEKITFDYGLLNWHIPDTADHEPDVSMAWVTGAPIGTKQQVNGSMYRNLIEFKIQKNFTSYCSIPEIQTAIKIATGVDAGFEITAAPMDVNIYLPDATPTHIKNFLTLSGNTSRTEGVFYPPYPATWRILAIIPFEPLAFTDSFGTILRESNNSPLLENV